MKPYLRAANVTWDGLALADVKSMQFSRSEVGTFRLERGDILLAEASGSADQVGKPAIWQDEIADCCFQNTLLRVRTAHMDRRFLLWFFKWLAFSGKFANSSRGVGIHHLGAHALSEWPTPIPPLPEQRRIVAAVDEELSRIDAGVAALARVQSRLTAMRAATLSAIANDKACSTVLFGTLVASVRGGKSFRCETRPAAEHEWGVIKVSAMTWGRFLEGENKALLPTVSPNPEYEIRPGDVLVSRANTVDYVGAAVEVPACRRRLLLSDKSLRLTPRSGVEPSWLVAVLQMQGTRRQIERVATGTSDSMRNISQPKLLSLRVPFAGPEFQKRFLRDLAVVDGTVSQLRQRVEIARRRSRGLRSSVLAAAFSGRIVPQNPSDEPASILLERIRAELLNGRGETTGPSPTKVAL